MSSERVIIAGGGAAGFFGAIACAQAAPGADVRIFEKGPRFLSKVRISGGGRCNVTHACFDVREMSERYPRGSRALISLLTRFQAADTVAWFEARGVRLKTEEDGRMFPVSDSSETIIQCLLREAGASGVRAIENCGVERVFRRRDGRFDVLLGNGETAACGQLLLATGGCRTPALGGIPVSLGHTIEPPVPSLFTFHIGQPWLKALAGVSVESAEVTIPGTPLRERGPLLITHWGLSGPVILRLSAWGARELHSRNYRFQLRVNWLPMMRHEDIFREFLTRRTSQGARWVVNAGLAPLPARLWEQIVLAAGIAPGVRWAAVSREQQRALAEQLTRCEFEADGKSLNKDEFVTCGGVRLSEVNLKTMESRLCPGLYFAGELLDIDGITGGFNFQAAWTTGWIAGRAMAAAASGSSG